MSAFQVHRSFPVGEGGKADRREAGGIIDKGGVGGFTTPEVD